MANNTQAEAFQRQYESTLTHLIEITDKPYLTNAMIVDTDIQGMTKIFKRIGSLEYKSKTGRNEIADLTEPEFTARHLNITTKYVATPLDEEDIMKMVANPKDDLYTECVHAIYDAHTDTAMAGFFADVIITEAGGSTSSFDTTNNRVAVNYSGGPFGQNSGASNVGLNIDKLLKVRSLISANRVRMNTSASNTLNIAITEDDLQQLMASKIGTDNFPGIEQFNQMKLNLTEAMKGIADNQFQWLGFTFHIVPSSYFLLASGHRRLPVWIRDGMVFGMETMVGSEIVKLPHTVESWKIQALTRVGAMRKHDKKVYEILVTV